MNDKDLIEKAITREAYADYLTAAFGERLGVFRDGRYAVGQSVGMEIAEDERPIALAKCPGLANLDTSYWTENVGRIEGGEYDGMYVYAPGKDSVPQILSEGQLIRAEILDYSDDAIEGMEELKEALLESATMG